MYIYFIFNKFPSAEKQASESADRSTVEPTAPFTRILPIGILHFIENEVCVKEY